MKISPPFSWAVRAALLASLAAVALSAELGDGASARLFAQADEQSPALTPIWSDLAPGETTKVRGEALPRRANENPPATRIAGITAPTLEVYEPPVEKRNGAAVLILPGGGYNYVVRDKEGSEAARWLNEQGYCAYVLRYRTRDLTGASGFGSGSHWRRPLQDAQRALSLLRSQAAQRGLRPDAIGILGFSAGGQTAALAATRFQQRAYEPQDDVDRTSCRPDFALLIYPWNLWNAAEQRLIPEIEIAADAPPTFLVHTHDDSSSSLGSVMFYAGLKQQKVPSELHVYESGGHGYGLRPVPGSQVSTWPDRAAPWLARQALPKEAR